nr:MAG TPA: hypothetical protein [Caudoviricetes sp.]
MHKYLLYDLTLNGWIRIALLPFILAKSHICTIL